MRKIISRFLPLIILTGCAASSATPPTTQPTQSITWHKWSPDVFAQARQQHKFVLLDLEAVWCHWCHVMDKNTYSNPAVIKLMNEKYLAVRVDQDDRPDLSARYGDWGWPATVVFNGKGQEIVIRQGYLPPKQMASILLAIIKDPSPGPSVHATAPVQTSKPALSQAVRTTPARNLITSYRNRRWPSWPPRR